MAWGETIEICATFSTAVDVGGTPSLGLWVGGNRQAANYLRGSGANTLVFGYTVKSEDRDDNGISMDGGYQDSNGTWHKFYQSPRRDGLRKLRGLGWWSCDRLPGLPGPRPTAGAQGGRQPAPIGTGMEITSEPTDGDFYRYGETIDIALTLSAPGRRRGRKESERPQRRRRRYLARPRVQNQAPAPTPWYSDIPFRPGTWTPTVSPSKTATFRTVSATAGAVAAPSRSRAPTSSCPPTSPGCPARQATG